MADRARGNGAAAKSAKTSKGTGKRRSSAKRAASDATAGSHGATKRASAGRAASGRGGAKRQPSKTRAKKAAAGRPAGTARTRNGAKASSGKRSGLGAVATVVRGTVAGAVAAVKRTVSGRRAPDAIVLLETDHRRMEDLFKRGEETTARGVERRRALLDTIASELSAHEMIEEKVFYPALRSHPEARDIVLEGFEEHHVADVVVKELGDVAADQEQWGAKFKVLQETIQHHIDEEEGEMFRTARAVLGQDELDALGKRMAGMKARARRS